MKLCDVMSNAVHNLYFLSLWNLGFPSFYNLKELNKTLNPFESVHKILCTEPSFQKSMLRHVICGPCKSSIVSQADILQDCSRELRQTKQLVS